MLALGLLKSGLGRSLTNSPVGCNAARCAAVAGFHTTASDFTLGDAIQYLRFKLYHDPRHHLDNDKWAKLFVVEGNIKVGKGAFAKEFAKKLDLRYFPSADFHYFFSSRTWFHPKEEIEFLLKPESYKMKTWNTSLEEVYENPKNWQNVGRYQKAMTKSRFYQYADALCHLIRTGQGAVLERSFHNLDVFRHAFRKQKWISKDLDTYLYQMHRRCARDMLRPQVMIYLDVSPEQCLENIKERGTPAERHITLDFLKAINEAYHTKVIPKAIKEGTKVIELDWSKPEPVDDVILDLDEMPTLHHEDTLWKQMKNHHLKMMMGHLSDENTLNQRSFTFCPIEEMWDPDWAELAEEHYDSVTPWKYRSGYNANLGDKNIWFKE